MHRPELQGLLVTVGILALAPTCGSDAGRSAATSTGTVVEATPTRHPGIVDFTKLTPLPFAGYPTDVAANYPPDFNKLPTCQAKSDERPDPNLPPLSCRFSGSEPTPGMIKTPSPDELPDIEELSRSIPAGWKIVDNRLFRFAIAIPGDWYSDIRPQGGAFSLMDKPFADAVVSGERPAGGIWCSFSARGVVTRESGSLPAVEEHLQSPNTTFGSLAGVIWDEGGGEGLAHYLHVAFTDGVVVFEADVHILHGGRGSDEIERDLRLVYEVFQTLQPY